jgi:hypothetical protein
MKYLRWILIGLAALLVILLVSLFAQYESLRQAEIISAHEFQRSQILERHAPLAPSEASVVRLWMTFDYVNKIFALPPDYLKTQLNVSDSHYPRLTIGEYAESVKVDQTTALTQVQNAVRNYTTSSIPITP